jgi:hypothetical protein
MRPLQLALLVAAFAAVGCDGGGFDLGKSDGGPDGGGAPDAAVSGCKSAWREGPMLNDPREQAAALLLPDGRVLVAGAHHIDPPNQRDIGSSEIFDPAKQTWTPTGSFHEMRGATRGLTVLVAGGKVLTRQQESVNFKTMTTRLIPSELYDPSIGTWTVTGWMSAHTNGPMVALPDGGALAVGGIDWLADKTRSNAQRYHADTGEWTETGALGAGRTGHFVIAVGGEVLIVGGSHTDCCAGPMLATAEAYNPGTGLFRAVGSMSEPRWYPACVELKDGRVLAAGSGVNDGRTAEIYDPKTETWVPTGSMAEARSQGSLTLLHDGRVLAAGGSDGSTDLSSAEIFDPAKGTWSPADSMTGRRRLHTAVTLRSGEVLIVGGFHYFQLSTTAIFTPCGE